MVTNNNNNNNNRHPRSPSTEEVAEEFEKKLLGNPNSSLLWIKYMSTMLQLVELNKARSIAERALQTISFREEQAKLNVWLAYLNLENTYGTPESMQKILNRSLVYCDARTIYLQVAQIYATSEKLNLARATYETLVKKFGQSCKVWVAYATFLYENDVGGARKLLMTALRALPKRKHEKITIKFAQLEYRKASIERGRTLFEGVLANKPKRIDLWSVYVTMEENVLRARRSNSTGNNSNNTNATVTITTTTTDHQYLRRLFERILTMKLSSKKAKYFFKQFLEFEKQYGTPATIEHVKDTARRYVEGLTA